MTILVLLVISFIALSGVMAAVDAAVLSITWPEVHELLAHEKRGSAALQAAKGELTRTVVVIVVLTNLVNVLGPIVVSRHAAALYGTGVLITIAVILTLGTSLFSEIIPKALGTRYAPEISRVAAPALRAVHWGMYPMVYCLDRLSQLFTRGTHRIGTEEQIRSLTTIGRRAGYIEHDEGRLIHRAFVLNDRTASDLMTPLTDVVSVDSSMSIAAALATVRSSNYSRFPVFDESPDHVSGIVLIRDILEAVNDGRSAERVATLSRPVFIVDASDRSDALLLHFRRRQTHLAVVQRDSRTVGVVSLEDVLEELVGEIEDEMDSERQTGTASISNTVQ